MVLDIYAKYTLTSLPAGLMYEDLSSFSSIFYDSTLSIYLSIYLSGYQARRKEASNRNRKRARDDAAR